MSAGEKDFPECAEVCSNYVSQDCSQDIVPSSDVESLIASPKLADFLWKHLSVVPDNKQQIVPFSQNSTVDNFNDDVSLSPVIPMSSSLNRLTNMDAMASISTEDDTDSDVASDIIVLLENPTAGGASIATNPNTDQPLATAAAGMMSRYSSQSTQDVTTQDSAQRDQECGVDAEITCDIAQLVTFLDETQYVDPLDPCFVATVDADFLAAENLGADLQDFSTMCNSVRDSPSLLASNTAMATVSTALQDNTGTDRMPSNSAAANSGRKLEDGDVEPMQCADVEGVMNSVDDRQCGTQISTGDGQRTQSLFSDSHKSSASPVNTAKTLADAEHATAAAAAAMNVEDDIQLSNDDELDADPVGPKRGRRSQSRCSDDTQSTAGSSSNSAESIRTLRPMPVRACRLATNNNSPSGKKKRGRPRLSDIGFTGGKIPCAASATKAAAKRQHQVGKIFKRCKKFKLQFTTEKNVERSSVAATGGQSGNRQRRFTSQNTPMSTQSQSCVEAVDLDLEYVDRTIKNVKKLLDQLQSSRDASVLPEVSSALLLIRSTLEATHHANEKEADEIAKVAQADALSLATKNELIRRGRLIGDRQRRVLALFPLYHVQSQRLEQLQLSMSVNPSAHSETIGQTQNSVSLLTTAVQAPSRAATGIQNTLTASSSETSASHGQRHVENSEQSGFPCDGKSGQTEDVVAGYQPRRKVSTALRNTGAAEKNDSSCRNRKSAEPGTCAKTFGESFSVVCDTAHVENLSSGAIVLPASSRDSAKVHAAEQPSASLAKRLDHIPLSQSTTSFFTGYGQSGTVTPIIPGHRLSPLSPAAFSDSSESGDRLVPVEFSDPESPFGVQVEENNDSRNSDCSSLLDEVISQTNVAPSVLDNTVVPSRSVSFRNYKSLSTLNPPVPVSVPVVRTVSMTISSGSSLSASRVAPTLPPVLHLELPHRRDQLTSGFASSEALPCPTVPCLPATQLPVPRVLTPPADLQVSKQFPPWLPPGTSATASVAFGSLSSALALPRQQTTAARRIAASSSLHQPGVRNQTSNQLIIVSTPEPFPVSSGSIQTVSASHKVSFGNKENQCGPIPKRPGLPPPPSSFSPILCSSPETSNSFSRQGSQSTSQPNLGLRLAADVSKSHQTGVEPLHRNVAWNASFRSENAAERIAVAPRGSGGKPTYGNIQQQPTYQNVETVDASQPTTKLKRSLKNLIADGLVQPGSGVLTLCSSSGAVLRASLRPNGQIEDSVGRVFGSATAWCKSALGLPTVTLSSAWHKVCYNGIPLSHFNPCRRTVAPPLAADRCSQPAIVSATEVSRGFEFEPDNRPVVAHRAALGATTILKSLPSMSIHLVDDRELVHLPPNTDFDRWFDSLAADSDFMSSIDCWN